MTISYTDNFQFPLLDTGSGNWGAGINGMLETVDRVLGESANPLIWEDDGSDYALFTASGKKTTTELLTYDGEILGYA